MQRAHLMDSYQTTPLPRSPRSLIIPMTTTAPTTSTPTTPSRQTIFEQVSTLPDKLAEKKIATTWFCGDCTVLKGQPHSSRHDQPPLGDDIYTKPFGRSHHNNQDVCMTMAGCHIRLYLHQLCDNLYESVQLGLSLHGR